jgi:hypothetical protein
VNGRANRIPADDCVDTIVTWGGTKPGGSHPRITGRRSTGSRVIRAGRMAAIRAPDASRSPIARWSPSTESRARSGACRARVDRLHRWNDGAKGCSLAPRRREQEAWSSCRPRGGRNRRQRLLRPERSDVRPMGHMQVREREVPEAIATARRLVRTSLKTASCAGSLRLMIRQRS